MDFSGKKTTGMGLPFLSPGDLPDSGMEPMSPPLQADSLQLSHQGSPESSLRVRIYSAPGTYLSTTAAISATIASGPLTPNQWSKSCQLTPHQASFNFKLLLEALAPPLWYFCFRAPTVWERNRKGFVFSLSLYSEEQSSNICQGLEGERSQTVVYAV